MKERLQIQLSAKGYLFTHWLFYECLKYIDRTPTANIRTFLTGGDYAVEVLQPFRDKWENVKGSGKPPPSEPEDQEEDKPKQSKQTFGPVTQQGEFTQLKACWARNPKSGKRAICNCYNDGKPCTRGVIGGPDDGKCAYWHVCNKCRDKLKFTHFAEQKDSSGNWVCPKHP